jgi:hypothetical protein
MAESHSVGPVAHATECPPKDSDVRVHRLRREVRIALSRAGEIRYARNIRAALEPDGGSSTPGPPQHASASGIISRQSAAIARRGSISKCSNPNPQASVRRQPGRPVT